MYRILGRNEVTMKKKTIAVCMADIDEQFNDVFLKQFRKLAEQYQYHILYFYSFSALYFMDSHDLGEKNIFRLINYDILDAVVMFPQTFCAGHDLLGEIVTLAQKRNIPVLSVDMETKGCINVCFDDTTALYQVISHVLEEHDVENVNFISGIQGDSCAEHRLDIFRKCMADHGRTVEEERIGYGDFWHEPTQAVMQNFFDSDLPFPDAIICANDAMAIAVYECLCKKGYRVPEDVIVTGYDGTPEAVHHFPPITTAKRDIVAAAARIFELLGRLFSGEQITTVQTVAPELLLQGSCGCQGNVGYNRNDLVRSLYYGQAGMKWFILDQIRMSAILAKATNFTEVFEGIKEYATKLGSRHFVICIPEDFVAEEEFSDIMENTVFYRTGYSARMNRMLYRRHGEWQERVDFDTEELLPNLQEVLDDSGSVFFFPLHIHDQTVGYAAVSFDEEAVNMIFYYQFFMNVSNALDLAKRRLRQQTIIQNLENKYVHDPLTGLYNRRGFYQGISDLYRQCGENGVLFKLLSIDLNGLKYINDTYGHADGDIAILAISDALHAVSGTSDCCARFGGDEFVVAGPVTDDGDSRQFVQKIRDYLRQFNARSGKPYEVDASIGMVTLVPDGAVTVDEVLKEADMLMYEEKARHYKEKGLK